jgi:phage FluMu protein Com
MKILKCKFCKGELDLISNSRNSVIKVKCKKCGFANFKEIKEPEIFTIRRKSIDV